MPQPVSYTTGNPVSGSLLDNRIAYVVDGQGRNYRDGYGGLSWMSEAQSNGNVVFIGNTTSVGRGPAGKPLFYPSFNTSDANVIYAVNKLPGSPGNLTTLSGAYNWAVTNTFFINNANNPIARVNADGMILYVDGEQPGSYPQTGTTWYDLSGGGIDASLVNGPAWNSNGWFDFDGADDWGRLTGLSLSTTAYTKIAWFNPDGATNNIISGGTDGMHAFWMAGTATSLQAGHNGSWSTVNYSPGTMTGRWWFGAVTFNTSTGWVLYLNGSVVDTSTSTSTFSGGATVRIAAYNDASNLFNGKISRAQVYNKVLSIDEIKQNYFQGNIVTDGLVLMADASNLVSYPKSGTIAYNLTGSLTGSLLNGVGFSTENGGNWTFDGVDDRIVFQSPFGNIDWGTTAFTVMGWIKVDSPNDNDWCLLSSATNSNLIFGTLPYPTANRLYVYGLRNSLGSPANQVFNFYANNLWPNSYYRDTWLHVTLTYNGNGLSLGNFAIYSNGVSRTLGNGGSAGYSNANVIQLGRSSYGTGPTEYPNLMVYNRALSASEVLQNYEATKYKFQGPQIVTNGLVMHLDAANKDSYSGTGTIWDDLTGNENNNTLTNGPSFLPNVNGGVLSFDGTDDFGLGSIPSATFSGASSIGCWFYRRSITSWAGLFSNNVGTTSCNLLTFIGDTNVIGINQAGVNASYIGIDLGADHLNKWIYCVLVLTGSTNGSQVNVYAYEDGNLLTATGNLYWDLSTHNQYYVGRHWTGATQILDGNIPVVQVYNRALSATEVAQNFNAQRTRFGI